MRTIWKYALNMGITTIMLPIESKPLYVTMQDGRVHLWVEQNATHDPPHREHTYFIVGTGHPLPEDYVCIVHIGSVTDGPFIWHVYRGIM